LFNQYERIGFNLDTISEVMEKKKPNILFVLPSYAIKWGGPSRVVHDLCSNLSGFFQFTILTTYTDTADEILPIPDGVKYVAFEVDKPISNIWKSYSSALEVWLSAHITEYDLIHMHEMWHYSQYIATKKALKHKIPYLVSPHGELDDWRIREKEIRKKLFGVIFQKKMLRSARVIHALTKHEAHSIQRFTGKVPNIQIIPNSISDLSFQNGIASAHHKPFVLFLGRLQKVKGCLELLQAYTNWSGRKDFDLVFAGLFEDEVYEQKIKTWINQHNLNASVHFKGLVSGSIKNALLNQAKLFVLPSFSEGFPVSVLEAMQSGCPLLISCFTGLHEVMEEKKAALICNPTVESITNNLENFSKMNQEQLSEMVSRSTELFESLFSRKKVMTNYADLYMNLIPSNTRLTSIENLADL